MSFAPLAYTSLHSLANDHNGLIRAVLPHLHANDVEALMLELRHHWPQRRLIRCLVSANDDATKIAALCLGYVADMSANAALARALHHDDSVVVTMAEHALWNIWFRGGVEENRRKICAAVLRIDARDSAGAMNLLDEVVAAEEGFAEAYHQRAVAHYLKDRFAASLADCRRTLKWNPLHFGAAACAGHCLCQLGRLSDAAAAYRKALDIHPRLNAVRQCLGQLRGQARG